jgi:hypothetical protein
MGPQKAEVRTGQAGQDAKSGAEASAFTRICASTNSLELKYFNFDANFA